MFKINNPGGYVHLSEIPQNNPLRWNILHRTGEEEFVNQTGEMKCRDFFNDLVAAKQEKHYFSIYGFNNEKIKWNDEGLWFLLTNLVNSDNFIKQVNEVVNPKIVEQLGEEARLKISVRSPTSAVLLIPNAFWESTYRISVVTMLLRASNYKTIFESWDDIFAPASPLNTSEGGTWTPKTRKYVQENGFIVPDHTKEHWFFYTKEANSKSIKDKWPVSYIHNCGANAWINAAV